MTKQRNYNQLHASMCRALVRFSHRWSRSLWSWSERCRIRRWLTIWLMRLSTWGRDRRTRNWSWASECVVVVDVVGEMTSAVAQSHRDRCVIGCLHDPANVQH